MAAYEIIEWRGIPAAVEARDERERVTQPLSERFQMLIDSVAMQLGLEGTEAYLEQWGRSPAREHPGSARDAAEAVAAGLERRFDEFVARAFRPA